MVTSMPDGWGKGDSGDSEDCNMLREVPISSTSCGIYIKASFAVINMDVSISYVNTYIGGGNVDGMDAGFTVG